MAWKDKPIAERRKLAEDGILFYEKQLFALEIEESRLTSTTDVLKRLRRDAWETIILALEHFVDVEERIGNTDDLPDVFHVQIVFANKDTDEVIRYYPVRMAKRSHRA